MILIGAIILLIILLAAFMFSTTTGFSRSLPSVRGGAQSTNNRNGLRSEGFRDDELQEISKILKGDGEVHLLIDELPDVLHYRKLPPNRFLYRIHIGQRKLLMNEVLFLTEYGDLSETIVYAGAAPAQHTPFLANLFPNHKFELWDPAPFMIEETDKIKIYNDFFTNETAEKYKDISALFISDIRSGSDTMSYEEFEKEVERNNQFHIDWVGIMNPAASMLKFRIPFTVKDKYKYFAGKVYLQPWAPIDSAESRLVFTSNDEFIDYDPKEYEDQMFYYNNIIREFQSTAHDIPLDKVKGLCLCHDCNFEIRVWRMYIEKILGIEDEGQIIEKVVGLMNGASEAVERSLLMKYHGLYPDEPMDVKRGKLKRAKQRV